MRRPKAIRMFCASHFSVLTSTFDLLPSFGMAVATSSVVMTEGERKLKQCAVLIVNCSGREISHTQALLQRGFRVVETAEWPADEAITAYEAVVIVLREMDIIAGVAARMRAKPRFGNRILIGVTLTPPSAAERRHAINSGFDDIVGESNDSRILVARILQRLRARPEHRCLVPERKRPAA